LAMLPTGSTGFEPAPPGLKVRCAAN